METVSELLDAIRTKFPIISARADALHARLFEDINPSSAYSWFESLANALNEEMVKEVPASVHAPLLKYINGSLGAADLKVRECIDVAFVENLFWQVPSDKCQPYWQQLPEALRKLYRDFHNREP